AVYRSPVAALASLVALGVALGVTFGIVTLAAGRGLPVAYQSRGFLVALVYGIGTDYCLLLFSRVREEAAGGAGGSDPVGAALRRATPVIATSAAAVALACALMALARFGLFRDSGPALAIGAAVVLAAIVTLAPALMRLAGGALFWPNSLRGGRRVARLWRAIPPPGVPNPLPVLAPARPVVRPRGPQGRRARAP